MRLRFQATLALLVILSAMPCFGRGRDATLRRDPATAVPLIPDGFGVNIHFTDPQPGEMKMLAASGVRWVRMDFKWDLTESAKGKYDFTPYDRLMSSLARYNIRALFILDYGNPLYDDGSPPRSRAVRHAFVAWAVAAAKHFAGRGIIWETWNEPNNQMFWRPRPNVHEYAELALAVARAFRTAVPNEKLVGPAVSEMDFAFLEGCFRAGLLEYWTAVSVHPYLRTDPELVAPGYTQLRELIRKYAPRSRQIAILSSEWGYSSVWRGMSEEKQGQFLSRQWLTNVANDIPLSIWYDWRDDGSDPTDPEHHFGLVSNSYHEGRDLVYDPKPAYLAAKTLSTFFNGYRFEKRLDAGGAENYVLVFSKGSERRFAAWTTAKRARRVVISLGTGQYSTSLHTGGDAGIVRTDEKGLAINLTAAPIYIRQHSARSE